MAKAPFRRPKFWLLVVLTLGLSLALSAMLPQGQLVAIWQDTLIRIKGLGISGVITFVVLYNLATVLFIPGAVLTLGGGILYGLFWGSVYVILAATLGATIAFLIGRYFARSWVCQRLQQYPQFRSIDSAVTQQGTKIVLLTRLSPIFPFNLMNYAYGVTGIALRDYILGSIGMIPGTVMYVYIGALMGDIALLGHSPELSPQAQIFQWTIRGLGLIATLATTLAITRIAQRALNEQINPPS